MKKILSSVVLFAISASAVLYGYAYSDVTPNQVNAVNSRSRILSASKEGSYRTYSEEIADAGGVRGFFTRPETRNNYPGVVLVHDNNGLNRDIREKADRLATFGYNVFAVDLFNGETAGTAGRAIELVTTLDQEAAIGDIKAAVAYLREMNSASVAVVGYGFGGGQALRTAMLDKLDAVVIYYGQVVTDRDDLLSVREPVLGLFAEGQTAVPTSDVSDFDRSLDGNSADHEVHVYDGVRDGFASTDSGNYSGRESEDSWGKMIAFLEKHLKHD